MNETVKEENQIEPEEARILKKIVLVRRVTGAWLLLVVVAMLNGIAREKLLVPLLGQEWALPVSGILLTALIYLATYVMVPILHAVGARSYWIIGGVWLALTLIFEIILGVVAGKSWPDIFQAYDISTGNLWLLVLLSTAISPHLAARLRGFIEK